MGDTNTLDLYLMYVPNQGGWGIFDTGSCPDPGAFPNWMYKKYEIPYSRWKEVFRKLQDVQRSLVTQEVLPSRDNQNIFPELSSLLE